MKSLYFSIPISHLKSKTMYLLMISTLILSCSTPKQEMVIHSRLIGAYAYDVGEPTDPEAQKFDQLANDEKIEINSGDQYIAVTTWYIVNACGSCQANIDIRNDTIQLIYKDTAEELCMSQSIEQVTYFIENPSSKKWLFLK